MSKAPAAGAPRQPLDKEAVIPDASDRNSELYQLGWRKGLDGRWRPPASLPGRRRR